MKFSRRKRSRPPLRGYGNPRNHFVNSLLKNGKAEEAFTINQSSLPGSRDQTDLCQ